MNARQKKPKIHFRSKEITFLRCFCPKIRSVAYRDRPILLWAPKASGNARYLWCSFATAAALLYCIRLCTRVHTEHEHSSKQSCRMWKRPESVLVGRFIVVQLFTLFCFSSPMLFIMLSISRFPKISAISIVRVPSLLSPHWLYFPPTSDLTWSLPVSVSSVNV